jgi:malate dehydrogenase
MCHIENFCVWGNHSPTMVPDLTYALVNKKKATDLVENAWIENTFTPEV